MPLLLPPVADVGATLIANIIAIGAATVNNRIDHGPVPLRFNITTGDFGARSHELFHSTVSTTFCASGAIALSKLAAGAADSM